MGSGDWVSHRVRKRFIVNADSSKKKGSFNAPISFVHAGGVWLLRWARSSVNAALMTSKRVSVVLGRGSLLKSVLARVKS